MAESSACQRVPELAAFRAALDQADAMAAKIREMWGDDLALIPSELYDYLLGVEELRQIMRGMKLVEVAEMVDTVSGRVLNTTSWMAETEKKVEAPCWKQEIAMGMYLDLDDVTAGNPLATKELAELRLAAKRYETARRMNPRQWKDAVEITIKHGITFDEIIDHMRPFMVPTAELSRWRALSPVGSDELLAPNTGNHE